MSAELNYDDRHIALLEALWGEGYLSPGGPEEVARVVENAPVAGAHMLDIGSGSGAIAVSLVRDHGAAHVTGIDIEEPVCAAARRRVAQAGLSDRITIRQVTPGPLPFDAASYDVVFSKDSIIHIPDKEALAADAFRVLKPGGWFAASDWLIAHDDAPSAEMAAYIAQEDLDFAMASPARYHRALKQAGFDNITLTNRNAWYTAVAREELARMSGPERPEWEATHGADLIAESIVTWTAMIKVLETGEHCPHHLLAQKPA
ncbi:methyltransferase domain-containing protein [Pseudosulfitobacter koreensis]|uniref:Methyltransferase domain-containing protein n=1 Tax=Pseudosulfitobacter koreensis TaxID=2968472 RepID=A0ABT1Z2Y6_9RHOB|nr:methyltransferase domain-containing protein [Pseudosulfitobacter koreense]MCR8827494.1 methyltransferase domain-containing protein [Pseudosulfitobacter koreense]